MAEYRTIKNEFWNNPWVENLDYKSKLLYIYLFTNIYVDNAGVMKVSLKRIEFEIGMNKEFIYKTLNYFSCENKVVLIDDYIWVVSFIKHQTSTSPMILKNIAKCLDKINSQDLIDTILDTYKTLSIPYVYSNNEQEDPIDTKEEEIELKEEDEIEDKTKNGILINWCKKESGWYHNKMKTIFPNIKILQTSKIDDTIIRGADVLRKLHTIDKKPLEEIDSVLKFIIEDYERRKTFNWAQNIQSLSSIRNIMKNELMKYEGVLNSMGDKKPEKSAEPKELLYPYYCIKHPESKTEPLPKNYFKECETCGKRMVMDVLSLKQVFNQIKEK